jgi:AcrR family transcriptional regulator
VGGELTAATNLDDIVAQAGISRAILYRHFDSKPDLYQAVLDTACARLGAATGHDGFTDSSVDGLLRAAADDPAGSRLLPTGRQRTRFPPRHGAVPRPDDDPHPQTPDQALPDPVWATWAAQLVPTVAIAAVIAWLDAGRPDLAAGRAREAANGVVRHRPDA